jgi:ribonuclease HI
VKLNVDGSSFGNPWLSGYGCLIMNFSSNWIISVSGSHGLASKIVNTELHAMARDLRMPFVLSHD